MTVYHYTVKAFFFDELNEEGWKESFTSRQNGRGVYYETKAFESVERRIESLHGFSGSQHLTALEVTSIKEVTIK